MSSNPFDMRATAPVSPNQWPAGGLSRRHRTVSVAELPLVILVHNPNKAEFYGNGDVSAESVPELLRILADSFEQQHKD